MTTEREEEEFVAWYEQPTTDKLYADFATWRAATAKQANKIAELESQLAKPHDLRVSELLNDNRRQAEKIAILQEILAEITQNPMWTHRLELLANEALEKAK